MGMHGYTDGMTANAPSRDRRIRTSAAGLLCGLVSNATYAANTAAEAPPLRMGLWEQHHTQTLNGADFEVPDFLVDQARQAGVDVAGDGRSERLCITPQNIASIGQPDDSQLPACRKENLRLTSKGLSLKLVCKDDSGAGEGTVNVVFDSPTYYHGQFDFSGTHQLFGDNTLPLQLSGKVSGHWLGPTCPGSP
jgi:hypothetical protein